MGDFSARVQAKLSDEEQGVGQHTFDASNTRFDSMTEGVMRNRELFLGFLEDTNHIAINTYYAKAE